ncbi:hypothetical protein CIW47_13350 [Mycolicibacterium sp. P1-5]|nr:hypothetical protein CIW47_13350 [Mycolicibacterium sp. P1-5]
MPDRTATLPEEMASLDRQASQTSTEIADLHQQLKDNAQQIKDLQDQLEVLNDYQYPQGAATNYEDPLVAVNSRGQTAAEAEYETGLVQNQLTDAQNLNDAMSDDLKAKNAYLQSLVDTMTQQMKAQSTETQDASRGGSR